LIAYSTYTDAELLRLLARDDSHAFETLYARHWEELYKTAFFLLKDGAACKDIVQTIFIWLWEHRKSLVIQSLPAYLKAAVKFKIANHIRDGRIRYGFFEELAGFHPLAQAAGSEEELEVKELAAIIRQAIDYLPGRCREIFRLSREEYLTNQEIARRMGLSVKTVENQMTIALRRIRASLGPHTAGGHLLSILLF